MIAAAFRGYCRTGRGASYRVWPVRNLVSVEEEPHLNKTDLISTVADRTGQSKRVTGDVVEELINQIQKTVKRGEKVTLPGFGTFERRARSARTARNPQTGEPIQVKASKVPAFKAGASFKTYVSGKR